MFSISLSHLQSKLNRYSVIGSLLYGLFCASFPTPEVVAVIGHIAYFLSAALFYFAMYIFYTENREMFRRLWANKKRILLITLFSLFVVVNSATLIYSIVQDVSYEVAGDVIATYMGKAFYYLPFLP